MSRLAPRERWLLGLGAAFLLAAAVWWLALAPALATLRGAPARHALLDEQLRSMRVLAAEAAQLKGLPRPEPALAQRALEQSVRELLGASANLVVTEGRATLTLNKASPQALAEWLARARANAHALPAEARLTRAAGVSGGVAGPALPASSTSLAGATGAAIPAPAWDGVLVFHLPRP